MTTTSPTHCNPSSWRGAGPLQTPTPSHCQTAGFGPKTTGRHTTTTPSPKPRNGSARPSFQSFTWRLLRQSRPVAPLGRCLKPRRQRSIRSTTMTSPLPSRRNRTGSTVATLSSGSGGATPPPANASSARICSHTARSSRVPPRGGKRRVVGSSTAPNRYTVNTTQSASLILHPG